MKSPTDPQLAHALTRLGLGINIVMHGFARLPNLPGFTAYLEKAFAGSVLPPSLVHFSAYGIVTAECIIGFLLLVGWQLRAALVAGSMLIFGLTFGMCLIQNWDVAGSQLIYLVIFTGLLATRRYDWFSLDSRREGK